MLITSIEEVKAQLPTSQWSKLSKLSAALEDAEETYLVPLLGTTLFMQVVELYENAKEKYGSVVPPGLELSEVKDENDTQAVRLIRQCQRVEILFMLANNSGLLAVSLNEGGGMNMVTGGNYDSSDENTMKRFVADAWSNAHRAADNLLAMLERDARKERPMFAGVWKESDAYYMHEDLLFSTAQELNRLYPIRGSREKFIELVPQLRQCQATYIEPEIGFDTLNELLGTRTSDTEKDPSRASVNRKALYYLQMALVCFMRYKSAPARERDVKDMADGDMHLNQAKSLLTQPDKSEEEEPEADSAPEHGQQEQKCCCEERFSGKTNDSLFDPFDGGLDRI